MRTRTAAAASALDLQRAQLKRLKAEAPRVR